MNYNIPRCPHCDVELELVGQTYRQNLADYYYETWEGACPECDRHYSWDEIYTFNRIDSFEELE